MRRAGRGEGEPGSAGRVPGAAGHPRGERQRARGVSHRALPGAPPHLCIPQWWVEINTILKKCNEINKITESSCLASKHSTMESSALPPAMLSFITRLTGNLLSQILSIVLSIYSRGMGCIIIVSRLNAPLTATIWHGENEFRYYASRTKSILSHLKCQVNWKVLSENVIYWKVLYSYRRWWGDLHRLRRPHVPQ